MFRHGIHYKVVNVVSTAAKYQRIAVVPTPSNLSNSTRNTSFTLVTEKRLLSGKSPFDNDSEAAPFQSAAQKKLSNFVPRKAAVNLTEKSRTFFNKILANPPRPEIIGVMMSYQQSKKEPRMVFSFSFVTSDEIPPMSEGVSLEVLEDGTPKPPNDSLNDGLPKLYIHPDAFLKVLGATVDLDQNHSIKLFDREGNEMDPDY